MTEEQRHDAISAEARAGYWKAEMNEAVERGNAKRAEMCERKCQFWLDRMNKLLGNS